MSHVDRSEKTQTLLSLLPESVDEGQAVHIIDDLIEAIRYHNEQYYVYAQPIIADVQYDHLFSLLAEIEKKFPAYIRPDSPTQRLEINLQEWFSKASHGGYHLLSLQNTYNAEQIGEWSDFLIKNSEQWTAFEFIVEPKFDGSSVHLIYEYGKFTQAISRGDGTVGEDITENIKVVRNLPLYIPQAKEIPSLRFRGEVLMPKNAFIQLNEYQQEEWLPLFANTRNATAGTLRQLDPQIVAQRNLVVFIHELLTWEEVGCTKHSEMFDLLAKRGLPFYRYKQYSSIDEVVAYCMDESTHKELLRLNLEFDGLVIKVNDLLQRVALGTTAHHPRRAIAYKFPALQVATKLMAITYQVWRTWVITPVASLDPVQLSGALIGKATLHNFDYIHDNDIRLDDYVWVQRSGEVIPYVVGPIVARRDGHEKPFVIPTHCPSCGSTITQQEGEVAWYCTNSICDAQIKEKLKHFVAKGCMNISGLGESIIELLVDAKLLSSYVDFYSLHLPEKRLQMSSLPWLAEKKIQQILSQIELSKSNNVRRLLHGLGVSFVGKKVATMLERYLAEQWVTTRDQFLSALTNIEALSWVFGLWPQTTHSLQTFFSDPLQVSLLHTVYTHWVNIFPTVMKSSVAGALDGVSCVITWTFPVSREEITAVLEWAGAKVTSTVTSKTTRLLAGEKAWSKLEKALALWVAIHTWHEAIKTIPVLQALDISSQSHKNTNAWTPQSPSLFG